jgi:hypothetical protein
VRSFAAAEDLGVTRVLLAVSISTSALMPGRSVGAPSTGSMLRRTAMRCTILTQLPVAFCAGSTANSAPEAGLIEATRAFHLRPG